MTIWLTGNRLHLMMMFSIHKSHCTVNSKLMKYYIDVCIILIVPGTCITGYMYMWILLHQRYFQCTTNHTWNIVQLQYRHHNQCHSCSIHLICYKMSYDVFSNERIQVDLYCNRSDKYIYNVRYNYNLSHNTEVLHVLSDNCCSFMSAGLLFRYKLHLPLICHIN